VLFLINSNESGITGTEFTRHSDYSL